jgi:predicted permease
VLLIGAALMVRSFIELHRTDLGFDPRNVMTFEVNLGQRYPDAGRREQFYYEFQQRLESLPGVTSAAAATPLPLTGLQFHGRYATQQPTGDDTPYRQANYRTVLPGYFETMRTPLLAGRHLTRADETDERRVIVVDSRLAQISWPNVDPIGQQVWLRLNDPEPVAFEVVGVVHRQLQDGIEADGRETVYFTARSAGQFGTNGWVVRTSVPPESILPLVRGELAAMDPALPLMQVRTMNDLVDAAMARTRFSLQLMTAFGVAALLIAAVGLYAAIQYIVRQRRAEIGVRISFGARPRNIFRLFVQHGLSLATAGIVIGAVAAIALAQTISSMIVDVATTDPVTYAVVAAFLLAIALVASALPALRAAHLDPMIVLREE